MYHTTQEGFVPPALGSCAGERAVGVEHQHAAPASGKIGLVALVSYTVQTCTIFAQHAAAS